MSTSVFAYYWTWKPLESNYSLKMESINEVTFVLLVDCLFCFTDYIPSAQERSDYGYVYITINSANLLIHFGFLLC